jgi:hypothetical protein
VKRQPTCARPFETYEACLVAGDALSWPEATSPPPLLHGPKPSIGKAIDCPLIGDMWVEASEVR